ncbi:MAG: LssY C-terminal domain-containing protein [Planctomycetia bacterium]|nr:LssY C-terminal domain-containing protein [Planctomycetia bacterium]
MALSLKSVCRRLFTTTYAPDPTLRTFLDRAQTQRGELAEVTVAVLDARESEQFFGVHVARRGIQPVYLRIANRSAQSLRLQPVSIDPNYYTPLEAAGVNHFSIAKRLSAFGVLAIWFLVPLLVFAPLKLITAYRANRRMSEFFRAHAFHLRPIPPGELAEGFVFTPLDAGTKVVHVRLQATGESLDEMIRTAQAAAAKRDPAARSPESTAAAPASAEFVFSIPVPGIAADYLRRDFETLIPPGALVSCNVRTLVERVCAMPAATTNAKDARPGDPANLVVIGDFDRLMSGFAARWDESETISLATCWKTVRAFLLGSDYRYSPVSPLHLFGRSQDVALQRTRRSINERLHLRLWLTPLVFRGQPVWVGQVSRDIGVRFTTRAWNLTTHRIDPDVDEARDYVLEDLLQAGRIEAAGYVDGVGPCDRASPRHNLTGDPYFTDGKRAVILLSSMRTTPLFVAWS